MEDLLTYLDNLLSLSPLARCMSAYIMASCAGNKNNLDSDISSSVHQFSNSRKSPCLPRYSSRIQGTSKCGGIKGQILVYNRKLMNLKFCTDNVPRYIIVMILQSATHSVSLQIK